jgi:hypothetical protein
VKAFMNPYNRRVPWPPFDERPKKESSLFRHLERLIRVIGLIVLCGLVWYISYDHGRSDTRKQIQKVELENIALREKLILAEEDLKATKDELADLRAGLGQEDLTVNQDELSGRDGSTESDQFSETILTPGETPEGQIDTDSGDEALQDGETTETSEGSPEARSGGRMSLREKENKAAFGGQVVLSLVKLNSIDLEVTVRIRYANSGRREAHIMNLGDLIDFKLGDQDHSLYLDQIRGNTAFFILDGLPQE